MRRCAEARIGRGPKRLSRARRRCDLETLVMIARLIESCQLERDFWLIPTAEVPLTNLVRE